MNSLSPFKKNEITIHNFSGYFLIGCLVAAFIGLFAVFKPFLIILLFTAILATAFYPLYEKILTLLKGKTRAASFITCFFILVILVVPLLIFIFFLAQQAIDTYFFIQYQIQNGYFDPYLKWEKGGSIYDFLVFLQTQFGAFINIDNVNLKQNLADAAKEIASSIAVQSPDLLRGGANLFRKFLELLLQIFILFFALYYFFKDGKYIIKRIMVLSPLPEKHETEIAKKFKEISLATLYGIFLTSLVQGIVGGIGFAIAGIPNSLFWGTTIALFSLVPIIGTAVIWLPASVILMASGHLFSGIFLFFWGLLLVSTVDNFLRAYLIGGRSNTNQLLTFLAVFGGIALFGLIGVIFGPLIMTLFFSFLHIYEIEYRNVLHKKEVSE